MKFLNIFGKPVNKDISKYRLDWDKKTRSKMQDTFKRWLRVYFPNHVIYEEVQVFGTKMSVDFLDYTAKIIYEVQGAQHQKYNSFMHGGDRMKYREQMRHDEKKREWAELNGYEFIEIFPDRVKEIERELNGKNNIDNSK